MIQKSKTYVGTELKMHIGFDYSGGGIELKDIDFNVDFFCEPEYVQHFEKRDLIVEDGEYYAAVDTNITGPGQLKMKMTAYIPSKQMFGNNRLRTEVAVCNTNVIIQKI